MASSHQNPTRRQPNPFDPIAAPPPTPTSQIILSTQPKTSDILAHLLHRLPPSLSLSPFPRNLSSPTIPKATADDEEDAAPLISLSAIDSSILSANGFFLLAPHPIPPQLPLSAESIAGSLFDLPHHRKQHLFPTEWPQLGYELDDNSTETFCLDLRCEAASDELELNDLVEFGREMEKIGMEVVEKLAAAVGFEKPGREKLRPLLWISDGKEKVGRAYPYVVGLHYQIRGRKQSLLSDSGWFSVSVQPDSVLVTLGDIAQVWSNGKLEKVRGRPLPKFENEDDNNSQSIAMSLLITLPGDGSIVESSKEHKMFNPFSFEDYARKVYHEPLSAKDPLLAYRI